MRYRLDWLEYWSDKRGHTDPRVNTIYAEVEGGYIEHQQSYNLLADDDQSARKKARNFINEQSTPIEVFSLTNQDTRKIIMTDYSEFDKWVDGVTGAKNPLSEEEA